MIRWRWLAAGVLGGWAVGCSDATPSELHDSRVEPIVAGEPSGSDQDGVVLLRGVMEDQGEMICTASLVGPNLILTAAHCVTYLTEGDFSCSVRGELIQNPTGGGRLGLHVSAADLEVYAGKAPRKSPLAHGLKVISTLPPDVCQDDLAFVVLDTALELPVVPMRLGRPALAHETAVLVGYGTSASSGYIDYKTQLRQQKRGLEVTAVGPDSIDDGVIDTPPRVLNVDGPSGCVGDSGGPLLAEASGAVLGVYSLQGGGGCSSQSVHSHLVHVPPYQGLIDKAFAAAGCEPVPELTPAAGGAGGASDTGGANGAAGESAEPSSATGGVGGTDGGASAEPEVTSQAAESSGCSVAPPRGFDTDAAYLVALLALSTVGRRRYRAA
jgi:trypsin